MKSSIIKLFIIPIAACLIIVGNFATSSFAIDCGSATVTMIGVNPGAGGTGSSAIKVAFTNDTDQAVGDWQPGEGRFFFLSERLGDQGLATLLTAYATDKPVWIRIADPGTTNSLITIIYLKAN